MAALLRIKGTEGSNSTPAKRQVRRISVREAGGVGAKVEGCGSPGALRKAGRSRGVVIKQALKVIHVVGEKARRPCGKGACVVRMPGDSWLVGGAYRR